MLFNSFVFVELLLVTFIIYYLPRLAKLQVIILILASLVFYSYDQPGFVLLLLYSAGLNTFISYYVVYGKPFWRKILVTGGVILNLSGLAFFKYSPLFAKLFFDTNHSIGHFLISVPLPIGISFFTFEGITLMVDVYSGRYFDSKTMIPINFKQTFKKYSIFYFFFPHFDRRSDSQSA